MAIITSVTKIICSDTLAAFFRPIYENHVFREEFHYGLGILNSNIPQIRPFNHHGQVEMEIAG